MVELKQLHGGFARRVHRVEADAIQQKTAAPAVGARMEQREELWRLADEGAEIAALGVIAAGTGPGEIAGFGRSAVFAADDVVYLAAPKCVRLVDEAILADVIGAFGNLPAEPFADVASLERGAGGRGSWQAA